MSSALPWFVLFLPLVVSGGDRIVFVTQFVASRQ